MGSQPYDVREGGTSSRDGAFPQRDGAFPQRDGAYPQRDGAFPQRDGAYPQSALDPPSDDFQRLCRSDIYRAITARIWTPPVQPAESLALFNQTTVTPRAIYFGPPRDYEQSQPAREQPRIPPPMQRPPGESRFPAHVQAEIDRWIGDSSSRYVRRPGSDVPPVQRPPGESRFPAQVQAEIDRLLGDSASRYMRRPGADAPPAYGAPTRSDVRRRIELGDATVDVPSNIDPSRPINYLVYFNGWRETHQTRRLAQAMREAPPNTVLIGVRWQDVDGAESNSHNQYSRRGGLPTVLNHVLSSLPELQRSRIAPQDRLTVAGFSGGYAAVGQVLSDPNIAHRVDRIVMFDAPSSAVRRYVSENLGAFASGQKQLVSVAGAWRSGDYQQLQQSLDRQFRARGSSLASARGLRFHYTNEGHDAIPQRWLGRAAFDRN